VAAGNQVGAHLLMGTGGEQGGGGRVQDAVGGHAQVCTGVCVLHMCGQLDQQQAQVQEPELELAHSAGEGIWEIYMHTVVT
jgi:hypothetical protein